MSVAAVILAAGASTRLGHPKQLATLSGERLLERAVRIAAEAGCDPVIVVLGSQADVIAGQCALSSAWIVRHAGWRDGLGSSIRVGIEALPMSAGAAILMTCDQPAVSPEHLRMLMIACREEPSASFYAGRNGVPACFPRDRFGELTGLTGDAGASRLLKSAVRVELPLGELDVDTEETFTMATRLFGSGRGVASAPHGPES